MPPDRRTIRDIRSAWEGMKQAQLDYGQYVIWFRFNRAATTSDLVYDTGPTRAWYPGVTLPCLNGEYSRAGQNFDDDGLYQVDRAHLIFSWFAFFQTLIADPDVSGQDHVNDRVVLDGKLFSVDSFLPKGRVADYFLTVSVDLTQVAESQLIEDPDNPIFSPYLAVADSPAGSYSSVSQHDSSLLDDGG